jgi:hypothetical protein
LGLFDLGCNPWFRGTKVVQDSLDLASEVDVRLLFALEVCSGRLLCSPMQGDNPPLIVAYG